MALKIISADKIFLRIVAEIFFCYHGKKIVGGNFFMTIIVTGGGRFKSDGTIDALQFTDSLNVIAAFER